jgi:hypothetical protein
MTSVQNAIEHIASIIDSADVATSPPVQVGPRWAAMTVTIDNQTFIVTVQPG